MSRRPARPGAQLGREADVVWSDETESRELSVQHIVLDGVGASPKSLSLQPPHQATLEPLAYGG